LLTIGYADEQSTDAGRKQFPIFHHVSRQHNEAVEIQISGSPRCPPNFFSAAWCILSLRVYFISRLLNISVRRSYRLSLPWFLPRFTDLVDSFIFLIPPYSRSSRSAITCLCYAQGRKGFPVRLPCLFHADSVYSVPYCS